MNFNLLMQIFVALGLGVKRNWHIFAGIILGIVFGILMHTFETPYNKSYFAMSGVCRTGIH